MATVNLIKPVPSAVTGVTMTAGVNSAVISWTASTSSTNKYQIYENTVNNSGTATLIATVTSNTYTVFGLTPGQYKYYWVKVIDVNGSTSAFSTYTGPTTTLTGTAFNALKLAINTEWRGTDDRSFAYRNNDIDHVQLNINYTPSGGSPTSTGWVNLTTAVTQSDGAGATWTNPTRVSAGDSQYAGSTVQVPGATKSLLISLSDASVPSTATVTGVQARVLGTVGGGSTPVGEYKTILQIVQVSGQTITSRLGVAKEFTYAAKNTPETVTVGGTTDVWSLTTAGTGVPAASSLTVTSPGGVGTSGTTTAATSVLTAVSGYSTWFNQGYIEWTAGDNELISISMMSRFGIAVTTGTGTGYVEVRTRLYDTTAAADVSGTTQNQILYYFQASPASTTGSLTPVFCPTRMFRGGYRGELVAGHTYRLFLDVRKMQTGSTTVDSITLYGFTLVNTDVGAII